MNSPSLHPMSDVPHLREFAPVTPESIAQAKQVQADERAASGLTFDGDRIRPAKVLTMPVRSAQPLAVRLDVAEVIDHAVEAYGLEAVIRCVRLVAAINGRDLV